MAIRALCCSIPNSVSDSNRTICCLFLSGGFLSCFQDGKFQILGDLQPDSRLTVFGYCARVLVLALISDKAGYDVNFENTSLPRMPFAIVIRQAWMW